jgi:hypothetical protein
VVQKTLFEDQKAVALTHPKKRSCEPAVTFPNSLFERKLKTSICQNEMQEMWNAASRTRMQANLELAWFCSGVSPTVNVLDSPFCRKQNLAKLFTTFSPPGSPSFQTLLCTITPATCLTYVLLLHISIATIATHLSLIEPHLSVMECTSKITQTALMPSIVFSIR